MNDYQQKRERDFVLPQTVYRQALYAVKDLSRLRHKLKYLEESAYVLEGHDMKMAICKGRLSDNTAKKAIDVASVKMRIRAIEEAFLRVPEAYRESLENKLVYDIPFGDDHCINTWKKWQQVLIYHVAVNLRLL